MVKHTQIIRRQTLMTILWQLKRIKVFPAKRIEAKFLFFFLNAIRDAGFFMSIISSLILGMRIEIQEKKQLKVLNVGRV